MYKGLENLSAYVAENKDIILKDIVFGGTYGNTVPLMRKELGVKGTVKLHPAELIGIDSLEEYDGVCGWKENANLEFKEVTIETRQYKVNTEFCADKLIGKFAEYKVRVGANEDALPFEAEIVEGLVKDLNKQIEKTVWNRLLTQETTNFSFEEAGATTAYDKVMATYMKMDESMLEDGIIFVSPSMFREYVKNLVEKNLYHYNPADGALDEIFIPGAGVKVRKANGLANRDMTFGTSPKNMIYATDFMGNAEEVKVWFSDDNDTYRVKVRFNCGAAFIFPDLVVSGR